MLNKAMSLSPDAQSRPLADSPRIFDNAVLDYFSRVNYRTPPLFYGPIAAALALWAVTRLGWGQAFAGFCLGYVVWTLNEYLGHRFMFHFEGKSPAARRFHFLVHGVHHDYPNDLSRVVMPLPMSLLMMSIAVIVLFSLGGAWFPALMAGFVVGYLGYDVVHAYVHCAEPRGALGRYLKRAHMLHHFRDQGRGFGVSAPWWDYVFGTSPRM